MLDGGTRHVLHDSIGQVVPSHNPRIWFDVVSRDSPREGLTEGHPQPLTYAQVEKLRRNPRLQYVDIFGVERRDALVEE